MEIKAIDKNNTILRDILISELIEAYPELIIYLVEEYGFYCVSCFISGWEKLEDGAKAHGIVGADFEEMLLSLNKIASGEMVYIKNTEDD